MGEKLQKGSARESVRGGLPSPSFHQVFARWLRGVRLALGDTQPAFAKRLGISDTSVSALELGDAKPSSERIDQVLDALGMDTAAFCRAMAEAARVWQDSEQLQAKRGRPRKSPLPPKRMPGEKGGKGP